MTSNVHSIQNHIDSIKEKITTQEYLDLCNATKKLYEDKPGQVYEMTFFAPYLKTGGRIVELLYERKTCLVELLRPAYFDEIVAYNIAYPYMFLGTEPWVRKPLERTSLSLQGEGCEECDESEGCDHIMNIQEVVVLSIKPKA